MESGKCPKFIKKTLPFLERNVKAGAYTDPNYKCDRVDGFGHKQSQRVLTQNVATAEIASGYLNLYSMDGNVKWLKRASESCYWLLDRQNEDGSWNEIVPYYNYPSVVASSVAGDALLQLYKVKKDKALLSASEKCKEFILRNEVGHGAFRKSTFMLMNTLNVNAHAGAFLAEYAKIAKNKSASDAARRAIFAIAKHQHPDGAIPYTDELRCYPSSLHYNVRTVHYQAVSLFYLLKIRRNVEDALLNNMIELGKANLQRSIYPSGHLKWQNSAFPYEYFQNAAYSFTLATLNDDGQLPQTDRILDILEKERLKDGGFARYQKLSPEYYLKSFAPHMLNTFYAGNFRTRDRLFRVKELFLKIYSAQDRRSQLFTTAKIFEGSTHSHLMLKNGTNEE